MSDERPQAFVDGEWHPAVPLPLYVRSWRTLFRWRYQCECGKTWTSERYYEIHWRFTHGAEPGGDT